MNEWPGLSLCQHNAEVGRQFMCAKRVAGGNLAGKPAYLTAELKR